MKIKTLALGALAIAALASCSGNKEAQTDYTLTVNVDDPASNGTMAYIVNFDTDSIMDSVVVADSKAVFAGTIDEPTMVDLNVNGYRVGRFILEGGETEFKNGRAMSDLNDRLFAFNDDLTARMDSFRNMVDTTFTEAEMTAFSEMVSLHMDSVMSKAIVDNVANPIGYMLFIQKAASMEAEEFNDFLKQFPDMAKYRRVGNIAKRFEAREATSAGKQYTDFEVEYNDSIYKLSDYVKPGQYTLVDFWASWCGPCKREIGIIKQLYDKYHGKGLNVVGVAVWEDPEQTQAYLNDNPIAWDIILNGQEGPTEIYGINGIPCIMLIDPDGKIVARDLFEDELVNTVSTAMGDAPVEAV